MKEIFFAHDRQESPDARKNFFELAGYSVQTFSNSGDLLKGLRDNTPTLVLMDVLVEGKNGFETAQAIQGQDPRRSYPVVLCSRFYRGRAFEEEARRCGVDQYLLLPMPLDELVRVVTKVIQNYQPPSGELRLKTA